MGRYTLPKDVRIRKSGDYEEIRKQGARYPTRHFIIFYLVRDSGGLRMGLAVGKGVGSAVKRNRVKRLLREFFRQSRPALEPQLCPAGRGLDLVFIPKNDAAQLSLQEVTEELYAGLTKLGLKLRKGVVANGQDHDLGAQDL